MTARIPAYIRENQINEIPNISFLRWDGAYANAKSKAVCRCEVDGFEWASSVCDLVRGRGCPQCAGVRRWLPEDRIAQINALTNISFVRWADGGYVNSHSKAVCRCAIDGFEWASSVTSLLDQSTGCPQCSGKRRWTASERIQQINNIPNVRFLRWADGEYRTSNSKAVCLCLIDGNEWSVKVSHLIDAGSGCPKCAVSGYRADKLGTLYVLRSDCGGMVKIGISNDYKERHSRLKRATPFPWSCIELIHGDGALIADAEKRLLKKLKVVSFPDKFEGFTEWRKWDDKLPLLLAQYR